MFVSKRKYDEMAADALFWQKQCRILQQPDRDSAGQFARKHIGILLALHNRLAITDGTYNPRSSLFRRVTKILKGKNNE